MLPFILTDKSGQFRCVVVVQVRITTLLCIAYYYRGGDNTWMSRCVYYSIISIKRMRYWKLSTLKQHFFSASSLQMA